MSQAPTVFICYDRKDCESQDPQQRWLDRLSEYLQPYQQQGRLKLWSDRDIVPGDRWDERTKLVLAEAEAAVLLVGPAFLASEYVYTTVMPRLLQRDRTDGVRIVPVIVRGCMFAEAKFNCPDDRGEVTWVSLATFRPVNSPEFPLTALSEGDRDKVFERVARCLLQPTEGDVEPFVPQPAASPGSSQTNTGSSTGVQVGTNYGNIVVNAPPATSPLETSASRATPPKNPFQLPAGKIEDASLVFGREREIDRVFEILNSGSSVALIGDREVGKSSLLSAIAALAPARLQLPRRPVYLHLQRVESEADFYQEFCHLAGIEECRGFQLRRSLERLRLLLLLDEVEKVRGDGFTSQVRDWLRGFAEGGDAPLRLVVAGCVPLDRLFPDSIGMVSPLQGICLEVPLNPWDEDRARSFVLARLAGTGVRFGEEQLGRMVRESRGYPKPLVRSAYELFRELTLNQ